jgi:hypothetical protein
VVKFFAKRDRAIKPAVVTPATSGTEEPRINPRRFHTLVLLTILAAALCHASASGSFVLLGVALLAAAISHGFVLRRLSGLAVRVPRALINGMILAAIANLILQLITGDRAMAITNLADFLTLVMFIKSLDRHRIRDDAQLLGLSFFVVIGALLNGQGLNLGLGLALYAPLAILSAVMLQVFSGDEHQRLHRGLGGLTPTDKSAKTQTTADGEGGKFGRQRHGSAGVQWAGLKALMRVGVLSAVLSLGAGVVAFMITPRQLAAQLGTALAPQIQGTRTGFRDSIQLGSAGLLQQDETPVIEVKVRNERGEGSAGVSGQLYLRGAVLTVYRGGRWQRGTSLPTMLESAGELEIKPASAGVGMVSYEITLRNSEQGEGRPLFAPLHPISIKMPMLRPLYFDPQTEMLTSQLDGGRVTYTVNAASDLRDLTGLTPEIESEGANVKEDVEIAQGEQSEEPSAKVQALAREVLAGVNVSEASDPSVRRQAARAMIEFFRANFQYTLEMVAPTDSTQDPTEYFLFDRRMGHCEYFASAMARLLNAVNVPARVVTGYVGAEYNTVSQSYTVRRSDAHAWVEVEVSPGRWATFDPTPPSELASSTRQGRGLLGWVRHTWEAIEFAWLGNVIAYDRGVNLDALGVGSPRDPGAAAMLWRARVERAQAFIAKWLPRDAVGRAIIVGLSVLGFGVVIVFFRRLIWPWMNRMLGGLLGRLGISPRRGKDLGIGKHAEVYSSALILLEEHDLGKPTVRGAIDHQRALARAETSAIAESFGIISMAYYRTEFGPPGVSADEGQLRKAGEALATLKALLAERSTRK